MLFSEILNKKGKQLAPEFEKLFDMVLENQTHDCDLLLTYINGFYNPEVYKWDNLDEKVSPYMIGLSYEGHSDRTHYNFIHNYTASAIAQITHQDYLKEIEYSEENRMGIEEKIGFESMTIQLEMLIYLKIWEADTFIKRFYQLARLINHEPYDWHFKLAESNRNDKATGTRQDIIRLKIRDRFKEKLPVLYDAFKIAYNTQIRNSIAHSKYSVLNRVIYLNNKIEKDPAAQLFGQSYDEWIDRFHTTMAIYNEQIGFFKKVNKFYGAVAEHHENMLQIRVSKKELVEELRFVEYRLDFKNWSWKRFTNP